MQEKETKAAYAPLKLDVSVRVIEPVKNLMGFASVKFNDCFVVENLKIIQGSKGLFVGMPSAPDGKGGYRETAKPITKEFREELNAAVLEATSSKPEKRLWSRPKLKNPRKQKPAAMQNADFGPQWPEVERRQTHAGKTKGL